MKRLNKEIDVIFLLDKSGSMYDVVEDTIGGYNSYLNEQRKNKIKTNITTILFDDKYTELHYRKNIKEISDLTNKEYFVSGSTALLDAIGKTINKIEHDVKDNKVLFVITTDGLENASIEYKKQDIKKLIEKHSKWEFIYLGANIDSYNEGTQIGIKCENIANFTKDKKGMKTMYKSIAKASDMMINSELSSSWKNELENYINNNKEN